MNLPQCDCLNDCGDDPRIRQGKAESCEQFKRDERIKKYYNSGLQQIVKALQFYIDDKNWQTTSAGFGGQYDPDPPAIIRDRGARAKAALDLIPMELRA